MNNRTVSGLTDVWEQVPFVQPFGDAFVNDDIVHDVVHSTGAYGAGRAKALAFDATESSETPKPFAQQARRDACGRVIPFASANHRATGPSPLRFHQSNPGGQRQMGGAKQTNRFAVRRQYS